jgi:F-type H+-transporting ATPase subunit alpha
MAEIKPAEISAIRKQVEGFESGATLEEVLQVGDGIARVYGLQFQYGELVEFDNGLEAIVLNLEETMLVWYF